MFDIFLGSVSYFVDRWYAMPDLEFDHRELVLQQIVNLTMFDHVPMDGRLSVKVILDMQFHNVTFFGVQGWTRRLSVAYEH